MGLIGHILDRVREGVGWQPPAPSDVDVLAPCFRCAELKRQHSIARCEAGYWKSMHARALEREAELQQRVEELEAKVKLRERQLFGKKTERKGRVRRDGDKTQAGSKRKRGQQRGARGHGRRDNSHLPVVVEPHDLPEDERDCPCCGMPLVADFGTEDAEFLEVEVKAYRRRVRRKRYRKVCNCPGAPGVLTPPAPLRLIPRNNYGISLWVLLLLEKFHFQRPTYRSVNMLAQLTGLELAQGTITDGFKRLVPLFEPFYRPMVDKQLSEARWHADETRWMVYASVEGKEGSRWYLWVFASKATTVFRLEPTRSAQVPREHFGEQARGILNVDRYSAYKVLLKDGRLILAFCWAHVRRDYLGLAKDRPKLEGWSLQWVARIDELYRLNRQRLALEAGTPAYAQAQGDLLGQIQEMEQKRDEQLKDETLHPAATKLLESLERHWEGLTIFVAHPEVPMDNNKAERELRNGAVGRKNYYGSGALWSGRLLVLLFSLFQTLLKWDINVGHWLTWYLEACAANGGNPPENAVDFLPWNLSEQQRSQLKAPIGLLGEQALESATLEPWDSS